MDPVIAPPLAENVAWAVNRTVAAQPVKSNRRLTVTEPPGEMLPAKAGRLGVTGVHAAPKVCVRVKLLISTSCATTTPELATLTGQMRWFCGPLLVRMFPPNTVVPAT